MRHGRKDPWDKPWVAYAAIGGIVIVVVLALAYFVGGMGHAAPSTASSGQVSSVQSTVTARPAIAATSTAAAGNTPVVIPTATPLSVPASGVYVTVSYLGSFSGSYGTTGALVTVQDSGNRLYSVDNSTGSMVTASFHKLDSSSKHELDVEITNEGKVVKFGTNSSPYGDVTISYQL